MLRRALAGMAIVTAVAVGCAKPPQTTPAGGFGSEGMDEGGMGDRGRGEMTQTGGTSSLETIYFDFDRFALRADAQSTLKANAQLLRDNPSWQIQIEGNCDERGSNEYNLALGKKRAEAARGYLVDLGIDSRRISTISYGEENPAVLGSNEMSWAKNRRDDFALR